MSFGPRPRNTSSLQASGNTHQRNRERVQWVGTDMHCQLPATRDQFGDTGTYAGCYLETHARVAGTHVVVIRPCPARGASLAWRQPVITLIRLLARREGLGSETPGLLAIRPTKRPPGTSAPMPLERAAELPKRSRPQKNRAQGN